MLKNLTFVGCFNREECTNFHFHPFRSLTSNKSRVLPRYKNGFLSVLLGNHHFDNDTRWMSNISFEVYTTTFCSLRFSVEQWMFLILGVGFCIGDQNLQFSQRFANFSFASFVEPTLTSKSFVNRRVYFQGIKWLN